MGCVNSVVVSIRCGLFGVLSDCVFLGALLVACCRLTCWWCLCLLCCVVIVVVGFACCLFVWGVVVKGILFGLVYSWLVLRFWVCGGLLCCVNSVVFTF